MAERQLDGSPPSDSCPSWCTRDHDPRDHPEDRLHQSRPRYAALVTGAPWLDGTSPAATAVVARLVQQTDSPLTWVEVTGEEGPGLRVSVTAESARQLVALLESLLAEAAG